MNEQKKMAPLLTTTDAAASSLSSPLFDNKETMTTTFEMDGLEERRLTPFRLEQRQDFEQLADKLDKVYTKFKIVEESAQTNHATYALAFDMLGSGVAAQLTANTSANVSALVDIALNLLPHVPYEPMLLSLGHLLAEHKLTARVYKHFMFAMWLCVWLENMAQERAQLVAKIEQQVSELTTKTASAAVDMYESMQVDKMFYEHFGAIIETSMQLLTSPDSRSLDKSFKVADMSEATLDSFVAMTKQFFVCACTLYATFMAHVSDTLVLSVRAALNDADTVRRHTLDTSTFDAARPLEWFTPKIDKFERTLGPYERILRWLDARRHTEPNKQDLRDYFARAYPTLLPGKCVALARMQAALGTLKFEESDFLRTHASHIFAQEIVPRLAEEDGAEALEKAMRCALALMCSVNLSTGEPFEEKADLAQIYEDILSKNK